MSQTLKELRQIASHVALFHDHLEITAERFQAILARHGLVDRWREFERTFLRTMP